MADYRARVYERYATMIQDAGQRFDSRSAIAWGRAYRSYLRNWLPSDKAAAIADVGCGGGRLLHLLATLGYADTVGVDISVEQIALARQVTGNVVEADAVHFLAGRRAIFDLLIGLDIVEHFTKVEVLDFLDACHGSLKVGGRLILQTPNAESPWGGTHRYNDITHELGLQVNSLSRLLRLSGFGAIEARECGPVTHGMISGLRWAAWRCIRAGLGLWNIVETGNAGSGVFTRVFLISGVKE